MLTVYHLGVSQSDRVVWLLEELELPYELVWFDRQPSMLAPPEYLALHPVATAPTIKDGDKVFCESVAIIEYIIHRHGKGRLGVAPDQDNYSDYLYWLNVGSAYLNAVGSVIMAKMLAPDTTENNIFYQSSLGRVKRYQNHFEQRLGESEYLAGPDFTGADVMNMFGLTSMPRIGGPTVDHLPNVVAYIAKIEQRPAYQKAMSIAGPNATRPA